MVGEMLNAIKSTLILGERDCCARRSAASRFAMLGDSDGAEKYRQSPAELSLGVCRRLRIEINLWCVRGENFHVGYDISLVAIKISISTSGNHDIFMLESKFIQGVSIYCKQRLSWVARRGEMEANIVGRM